jgi:hypothetical protein
VSVAVLLGKVAVMGEGAVSMGPGFGVLVDAVGLGLALSGAVEDAGGEGKSTDESGRDMLACLMVGWVVGSGAEMVDVLSDGG